VELIKEYTKRILKIVYPERYPEEEGGFITGDNAGHWDMEELYTTKKIRELLIEFQQEVAENGKTEEIPNG
jgi:hypothetical protein